MIKYLFCDVDGTLTDGKIILTADNCETKAFSARDGLILKVLPLLGIETVFFTGRESLIVESRAKELDVCHVFQNVADKQEKLNSIMLGKGMKFSEIAYIGDDVNDYGAMYLCGFKACPSDAANEIKSICNYISAYSGGNGAVRDICEVILKKQGLWERFLRLFK